MASLPATRIDEFKKGFHGKVLLPSDTGYDEARAMWNAMIDRRPALIARCADTSDVVHAVRLAKETGVLLAIRGGGHNIAGSALCDGGIVIDMTQRKAATVDAKACARHPH